MNVLFELLKNLLPLEVATLIIIFIFILKAIKDLAQDFVNLAEKQTEYLQQRLESVDTATGIFERTIRHQETDLKRLYEINTELKKQLSAARQEASSSALKVVSQQVGEFDPDLIATVWAEIVRVHNHAKAVHLLAQEIDLKTYLQPRLEQLHAYDHVVKSKALELKLCEPPKGEAETGVLTHLQKALAHEYRAFIDSADWLTFILREKIIDTLKPYRTSTIQAALPEYYSELRPMIDRICREIATVREKWDDGTFNHVGETINKYRIFIEQLFDAYQHIVASIPALENARRIGKLKK